MKLRWAPGSPFVRKVTVTAIETGLDGRIERIETDYRPQDGALVRDNPLGRVPALIRDDGSVLADSPVICAWLDSLHDGPKLIPDAGEARWRALNLEGLGDGLGEAAIAVQRERSRPEDKRWDAWATPWPGSRPTPASSTVRSRSARSRLPARWAGSSSACPT